MSHLQQIQPIKKLSKEVSFETIKRRLKKLTQEEFPVLFTYGDNNLYWFHSASKYTSLPNELEVLNNLRDFFVLNLDKKQLNKYYEIHKRHYNFDNITRYEGSYDIGCAGGTISFGINLDHNTMITKIDEYIAIYHN